MATNATAHRTGPSGVRRRHPRAFVDFDAPSLSFLLAIPAKSRFKIIVGLQNL